MPVANLITSAQGYAGTVTTQASSALNAATSLVSAIGYIQPNFTPVTLPKAPPATLGLTVPVLADVALDLPAEPSATLTFQDISAIEAGAAPVLLASLPTLTMPTEPAQLAAFLQAAPGLNTAIVFPEPPSVLMNPMIEAPVLPERVSPVAPQVSLPVFGALVPVDNSVAPDDLEGSFRAAYRDAAPNTIAMLNGYVDAQLAKYNPRYHEQMAAIEAQLTVYLAGGTGLKPAVEDAIYSRARERNDEEAQRMRNAAYADAAQRGFTIPDGALMAAVARARQAGANNNLKASSDIVVMQAELEQKNLQFAVTQSANLRQTMLSAALAYHGNLVSINGQAIEYAKTVLGAIIEVYNTAVKAYSVKLDGYRAEAVVYETRLKSAMAGIELYKVEIDALEALTNVDKAKVDVYRARIDALVSMSNVYRAQIEAVVGRVSMEKLKIDVFQAQVQGYTAQVQGKNAEWQGYSAAIEGQGAKVKMFGAQVDAFQAQTQGYKATIEAKAEVIKAQALTNEARARQYTAAMSGYSTVVQARGEKARTQLENQRQELVSFQMQVTAAIGNAGVQSDYYKAVSLVGMENAKLQMTAQIQTGDNARAFGASIAQLGIASAGVYQGLASSAMAGMNSLSAEIKNE